MIDDITKQLFCRVPREVGNPKRSLVSSLNEIDRFVTNNSNKTDQVFISLYPSNFIIDKVLFDMDFGDNVLTETKHLYSYFLENDYPCIPVVSGLKGSRKLPHYHLYLLTKPRIYGQDAKLLLYKTAYRIIEDVFGEFIEKLMDESGKQKRVILVDGHVISPDPACIGDIRRLVRIPNTPRLSSPKTFCTYLPNDFPKMSEKEIIEYSLTTHQLPMPIFDSYPLLTDFEYDLNKVRVLTPRSVVASSITIPDGNTNKYLKAILRSCIYRAITHIHPTHTVRVIAVVDLHVLGIPDDQIVSLLSTLGWEDFNEQITRHFLSYCKKYKSYSCSKLKEIGVCDGSCFG